MEHIKKFWDSNAETFKDSHWASWGDLYAIKLETDCIGKYIKDGDYVLDAGCANGYSIGEQIKNHNVSIIGIDYSEKMIEFAKQQDFKNATFKVGDIKNIPFPDGTFDVTYTTRVLINIPTWKEQLIAIAECIRVTKPNGIIIFSEGFWEPLNKLNALRTVCGLGPLVEHDFNRYLKQNRLEQYLNDNSLLFEVEDFSSMYYLGSRVLRELMTDHTSLNGYLNPINEEFYRLAKTYTGGGFGIQTAYVIKKADR